MKSLLLLLAIAVCAEAQSIGDVARQERARQAATASRVFTMDDIKAPSSAATVGEASSETESKADSEDKETPDAKADSKSASEKAAPAVETVSPAEILQKWNAEVGKVRARVRELQDEETQTQLQINEWTNKVYAPVTTQQARNQAQSGLAAAQKKLGDIRQGLSAVRNQLRAMESSGPPTGPSAGSKSK